MKEENHPLSPSLSKEGELVKVRAGISSLQVPLYVEGGFRGISKIKGAKIE